MLRGPLHVLSGGNWLGRHSAALLLHLLLCHLVTFSFLFIMILIMIIIIIHNHHHCFVDADAAYQEQQRSTLVKWRQAGGTGQILMMIIKSDQSQVRYWASESSTTMRMMTMIVMTCNEWGWEFSLRILYHQKWSKFQFQTVVVTGATSGVGKETAIELSRFLTHSCCHLQWDFAENHTHIL